MGAQQEETFRVPAGEIQNRIKRIQAQMRQTELAGLVVIQRVDLFYFSGTAQNGVLYVPIEGQPLLMIKKYAPRARQESGIETLVEIDSIKEIPRCISDFYGALPATLGFEFDVLPVRDFNFYRSLFPRAECVDASPQIHNVRKLKSEWEIVQLEQTADLSARTFEYIRRNLRPGYTEMEFAGLVETYARKLGHGAQLRIRDYQTEGYPWHILSGKNGGLVGLLDSPASGEGTSPAFPCGAGNKKLAPNEPIMIDFGFVHRGYHIDETRMFAIGDMPPKAYAACRAALEIHNEVLRQVRPGVILDSLFAVSVAKARSLGYEEYYLGPPGCKVAFIGHGVGLELIEPPIMAAKKNEALQPGMVFALEPKMVFENEFSAGIESVFLVTESGHRLLSRVPLEIFICR